MGIKLNYNSYSKLVQRALNRSTKLGDQASLRLSSGERINSTADDPTGKAASVKLQYDIQGLTQNKQNVKTALSLVGTAEGELDSLTETLQKARTLAVQASTDTLNASNRKELQTELDALMSEIQRVASSSKYGDQFLLNGQLSNSSVQIGTKSNEKVQISLGDFRTSALGSRAVKTSDQSVGTTALTAGSLKINGVDVPASTDDSTSATAADASAIAKATAINNIESKTGVHAEAQPTVLSGVAAVGALTLDGTTNTLQINGVNIGPVSVSAGDSDGALAEAINNQSDTTGVSATVNASGQLVLTAEDGRNIQLTTTGSIGDDLGLMAAAGDMNTVATGTVKLTSSTSFTIADSTGALGMVPNSQTVAQDSAYALDSLSVDDADSASEALLSIDAAIKQVSDGLTTIGSVYNRLQSITSTLTEKVTNLTSADSEISDADYAAETATYTQQQILQEAAIAMLAQANAAPQKAIELLRG